MAISWRSATSVRTGLIGALAGVAALFTYHAVADGFGDEGGEVIDTSGAPASSIPANAFIAVAPGARGTGTGAALLRRGLERVDAQGTVAHLEATTRRAASFYGRHGFVDSAILNSEGRLPDYWAMTRPKRRQH